MRNLFDLPVIVKDRSQYSYDWLFLVFRVSYVPFSDTEDQLIQKCFCNSDGSLDGGQIATQIMVSNELFIDPR